MSRMEVIRGDITALAVDAIVNAANSSLMGGGGVDGAIHRVGGTAILEACKAIRGAQGECPAGQAVVTTAGNLNARFVIHAVGPVWRGGKHGEEALLASTYRRSLEIAVDHGLSRVAFPNISTGVYGFPKAAAAEIAIRAVKEHVDRYDIPERVLFCCFDEENYRIYIKLIP